ncbi:hypothetical protein ACET3Z_009136 [Daucus carota]
MAGSSGVSSNTTPSLAPKILLAKPALVTSSAAKYNRSGADDDSTSSHSIRSRTPPIGSLNLVSDSSWDFHADRFLPFLTDNTDFTVVGVIGPPGVGKSTILNELYGFDGTSPGMLPPFAIESEETKASARHCTVGIEPRISNERIILLDTQPVYSPSVLAEMIRPDGSSTISVLGGESLSAELAHELMGIQLGVFLTSICHIVVVVSDGLHDMNMWNLMSTVDLLKHGIPDPSSLTLQYPQSSNLGASDKESKDRIQDGGEEYVATPVFVHAKLLDQDLAPHTLVHLKKGLTQYFTSSSFVRSKNQYAVKDSNNSSENLISQIYDLESELKLYLLPYQRKDGSSKAQYSSYATMLWNIRDQILSMDTPSFSRTLSERDWLKNSAKVWDLVKNSPIIAEYSRTLQSSGMFRR